MLEIWQIEIRSFAAMLVEHKLAPRYPYGGVCNETELGNFTCKIFSDAKRERERSFTFSPTDIPTRQFVFYLCLGWAYLCHGQELVWSSIQESLMNLGRP
jgi:hypothetical protein